MTILIVGLAIFFATHLWTALMRDRRAALIARIGSGPYRGLYSLVAIAGLALIVVGWRGADASAIYAPAPWLRHVAYLLMLIALILLASAYAPRGRLAAAAKHPMLASVKIWAFAHLLANGEARSVVLFGSLLAYAVIARIAAKKRGETPPPAGPAANDLIAIAAGVAAWAAIYFFLHRYIAGVPLSP